MDWLLVGGLGLAVLAGGVVQSTIGFGMAVVAAPFVVLLAPDLMPGALLLPTLALPAAAADARRARHRLAAARLGAGCADPLHAGGRRSRRRGSRRGRSPRWSASSSSSPSRCRCAPSSCGRRHATRPWPGRSRGSPVPPPRSVGRSSRSCSSTNDRSGCARRWRSSSSPGRSSGSAGLLAGGELTRAQVAAGLVWVPLGLLGYAVAAPVRARIDPETFRRVVLAFCVLASLTVIARAALA